MSTSSEEFSKFVNRLLYEDTSKFQLPKFYILTNFREGANN